MKIEAEEIQAMLLMAKAYKPVVEEGVNILLDEYGPLLGKIVNEVREHMVLSTDKSIKQFIDLKYTKDEAILLTLNSKLALEQALQNAGKNKK